MADEVWRERGASSMPLARLTPARHRRAGRRAARARGVYIVPLPSTHPSRHLPQPPRLFALPPIAAGLERDTGDPARVCSAASGVDEGRAKEVPLERTLERASLEGARMRELVRYLGMSLLLVLACGGDSSTNACANLACLQKGADLMFNCAASGACVAQKDLTAVPTTSSQCFDNGVKILATQEMTSGSTGYRSTMTYRVKKGDALCYTRTFVSSTSLTDSAHPMDITLQDASGATLVTTSMDANNVATVTCPGGEPTVFADTCGYPSLAVNGAYAVQGTSAPTCTDGACSF